MKSNIVIITILLIVAIAGGLYLYKGKDALPETVQPAITSIENTVSDIAQDDTDTPDNPANMQSPNIQNAAMTGSALEMEHADEEFNLEKALAERTVGNPDAPVKIEEFASLSCSHCAQFHTTTFKELLDKDIKEGRVFLVYNDLPTSASALAAAQLTRCVDEKYYFKLLDTLFKTQEDWAYGADYQAKLKQIGRLLGMSDADFANCMSNTDLRDGIIANVDNKTEGFNINSTPSFIINGKDVVTGAQKYEHFEKLIDKHAGAAE